MDATRAHKFGSAESVKTKIYHYNCKLNNSKINESEREKFSQKLKIAKLALLFFERNPLTLPLELRKIPLASIVETLKAVKATIYPVAKREIKLVDTQLRKARGAVAVERLAAQAAVAAQAAAAEARKETDQLLDQYELDEKEELAEKETLSQLSELYTIEEEVLQEERALKEKRALEEEERALEDIANSKSAMEEMVALKEIYQYIIDTRSFIYTSGSAKLLKPDNSNKSGVAILGVIEAIGRAILLPFVAIAQCFICLAEGRKVNMRPYIDTFSAPFNPQEN